MADAAIYEFSARQSALTCCVCGVMFCMPENLVSKRRDDHKTFFCPNGHEQGFYGESKAEKLEKELARERRILESTRAEAQRAREARDAAERRASAARGQVTKIKNRVGNGVCPCCNRTFQNLMRHMSTKHPEFKKEDGTTS